MAEYRRSAHAVFDLRYHVVWITKYRYKILRGRVSERARDLIRQSCEAREGGDHAGRGIAGPYPYATVGTGAYGAVEVGAISEGAVFASAAGGVPGVAKAVLGGSTYGHAGTSARRWARWTRQRSRPILRTRS